MVHSQSVPNSPSIQRAAETSPSASSLQQQLGAAAPTTNGSSNFTFDNVMLTATPTHISPSDLNSGKVTCCTCICRCVMDMTFCFGTGTSQEARDEKEKTEAFSRLHQGKTHGCNTNANFKFCSTQDYTFGSF